MLAMSGIFDLGHCVTEGQLRGMFNADQIKSIRWHQSIMRNWAQLTVDMYSHGSDNSNKLDDILTPNKTGIESISNEDFMDQVINDSESAQVVQNSINAMVGNGQDNNQNDNPNNPESDNEFENEDELKQEILKDEDNDDDDDDDVDIISPGSMDVNDDCVAEHSGNLNYLFASINKHLQVPGRVHRRQYKLVKKHLKRAAECVWRDNPLVMYCTLLMLAGERFALKHLCVIFDIFNNLAIEEWSTFLRNMPRNATEYFASSPSNKTPNTVLAYCVANPEQENDSISDGKSIPKATKQKYLKHYMAKISIADKIKMNMKNFNKQQLILNGQKRRTENNRICTLVLDDLSLLHHLDYQCVPFEQSIRCQAPSIFVFGHYTCVPNKMYPNFPIIVHTGGVLGRFSADNQSLELMFVMKVWKNKALVVDNCSNRPFFYNNKVKALPQAIPRNSLATVSPDWTFNDENLALIHSNDGTVFPVIILEGVVLHLRVPFKDTYYATFAQINVPVKRDHWVVKSNFDDYTYEDYDLCIDNGKQINRAIKRLDYPGVVKQIKWNCNEIQNGEKQVSVLDSFDFVGKFVTCFKGTKSVNDQSNTVGAKFYTVWTDDFIGHATADYHESVQATAVRMNDEPNNSPSTISLKYAHAGHSIMSNALESEILQMIIYGVIVEYANPVSRQLEPQVKFAFPLFYAADSPARQKLTRDAGHKGTHSNPKLLGKTGDLSYDGKHKHYCGYLPDSTMMKNKGYFDLCKIALQQTRVMTWKKGLQRAMSCCSKFYSPRIQPTYKYIDEMGLFCVDDFHMGPGGIFKTTIQSAHHLITNNDLVMTKIWTKLYELGTTTSPYHSNPSMSCFLSTKTPNKFIHIYKALFSVTEACPLVSLQPQFMDRLQHSQRQRNIQDFLECLHWLISAWGRMHTTYANSRHFQKYYIENVLVAFEMKLQSIKELAMPGGFDEDTSGSTRKHHKTAKKHKTNNRKKNNNNNVNNNNNNNNVNNNNNNSNDNVNHIEHLLVVNKSLQQIQQLTTSLQSLSNTHTNDKSMCIEQQPTVYEENDNKDGNRTQQPMDLADKNVIQKIGDILNKPNFKASIELFSDAYFNPFGVSNTRMFEESLQKPKRSLLTSDRRDLEMQLVTQMSNLNKRYIWEDYFAAGADNSTELQKDSFQQHLSAQVRTSKLHYFWNLICFYVIICVLFRFTV